LFEVGRFYLEERLLGLGSFFELLLSYFWVVEAEVLLEVSVFVVEAVFGLDSLGLVGELLEPVAQLEELPVA